MIASPVTMPKYCTICRPSMVGVVVVIIVFVLSKTREQSDELHAKANPCYRGRVRRYRQDRFLRQHVPTDAHLQFGRSFDNALHTCFAKKERTRTHRVEGRFAFSLVAKSLRNLIVQMKARLHGTSQFGQYCVWLVTVSLVTPSEATDWPQYRGPNHDGISTEAIRLNWSEEAPRLLWKVPLEPALSSFSISGGRAFTQARRRVSGEDQEFCIALNADTGQEIWARPLGIAVYDGGVGSDDGPRSTPSVDGDRVYVFTSYLKIYCFEAATGQEIWSKQFEAPVVAWQNAASPLILGDLIFLNCNVPNGRLVALRKEDGSVVWQGQNDQMTQATPVLATVAETPQVIYFAQSGLVSVVPETGKVLWRYPLPFRTSTAASPVVAGDVVYCSAAYGVGAGAVRVANAGASLPASEVWRTPGANMNHWATPIYHDGHLYGVYGQSLLSLRCVELSTGTEKWRQGGVGYGSVLFVNGHVLVLTADGDLVLVKPDPSKYVEVERFTAITRNPVKCWNVPAISNGRIYVRSTLQGAAYDVSVPTPPQPKPKLKLQFARPQTGASFRLLVGNEDGSPLDLNRASNIDIYVSSELGPGSAGWTKLNLSPVLDNGVLRIDDSESASKPHRFFKSQERP